MNIKNSGFKPSDFYLFIDESGTSEYIRLKRLKKRMGWDVFKPDPDKPSLFTLLGLLIKESEFKEKMIPVVKEFKLKKYKDDKILIHHTDIVFGGKKFSLYKNNPALLKRHMEDLSIKLQNIDFYILPITIIKVDMLNKYKKEVAQPYKFTTQVIMERVGKNFCNSTKKITIREWGESRKKCDNRNLKKFTIMLLKLSLSDLKNQFPQPIYKDSIDNLRKIEWHLHFMPKDIRKIDKDFFKMHIPKELGEDIAIGTQVADLICSTIRSYNEINLYGIGEKNIKIEQAMQSLCNLAKVKIMPRTTVTSNRMKWDMKETIGTVLPRS